jgi:hypothetical protein
MAVNYWWKPPQWEGALEQERQAIIDLNRKLKELSHATDKSSGSRASTGGDTRKTLVDEL